MAGTAMRTLPDELLRATAKGEKASKQVRAAARMLSVDFDAAAAAELGLRTAGGALCKPAGCNWLGLAGGAGGRG